MPPTFECRLYPRYREFTVGRRLPSNSRSRTPCSRSGSHRLAPPPAAYRGTADIAGDRGGGWRRRPLNPRQTSSRPGRKTAHPRLDGSLPTQTRLPGRSKAARRRAGEPAILLFRFHEAAGRDLTHPASSRQSRRAAPWPRVTWELRHKSAVDWQSERVSGGPQTMRPPWNAKQHTGLYSRDSA
jgi:hypothetical protein